MASIRFLGENMDFFDRVPLRKKFSMAFVLEFCLGLFLLIYLFFSPYIVGQYMFGYVLGAEFISTHPRLTYVLLILFGMCMGLIYGLNLNLYKKRLLNTK